MIENLIKDTLKQANVPVYFMRCYDSQMPNQYITWTMALETCESYADDNEQLTGYYVQVNIWSKIDYLTLKKTVKQKMLEAGFSLRDENDGPYDYETNYYNRVQRYFYSKEVI